MEDVDEYDQSFQEIYNAELYYKNRYHFYEHPNKLPGLICSFLFDSYGFDPDKWYSSIAIHDKCQGVLYETWLNPDNPINEIYVYYQIRDHIEDTREIKKITICEDGFINYQNYIGSNRNIYVGRALYMTCVQMNNTFLYSKLFLGYEYKYRYPDCKKNIYLLPVFKGVIPSLKNLSRNRIRLLAAKQLGFLDETNEYEGELKHFTVDYKGCWHPALINFLKEFTRDNTQFIKDIILNLPKI
jgi:hypothetical protein